MSRCWIIFICAFCCIRNVYGSDDFPSRNNLPECEVPMTAIEWILSKRENYGWGSDTHRAIIALASEDFGTVPDDDVLLMKQELDVQLSQALLRNLTTRMPLSDLALYIHALLSICRDPRDFYGIDLVEDIYWRTVVDHTDPASALAALAVCNANSATEIHLQCVSRILTSNSGTKSRREKAIIALIAVACILEKDDRNYSPLKDRFLRDLAQDQEKDGSFGNIYTTALAVQALIFSNFSGPWDEYAAMKFLRNQNSQWNMISAYYVILAQNARKIKFLKSLPCNRKAVPPKGLFPSLTEIKRWPKSHYIRYIIRLDETSPAKVEISILMLVPGNATFFDIMRLAADEDSKFKFSWHFNSSRNLVVYSISGIANDAEIGLYWHLYEQKRGVGRECPVSSSLKEYKDSPASFTPEAGSNLIYWLHNIAENKA